MDINKNSKKPEITKNDESLKKISDLEIEIEQLAPKHNLKINKSFLDQELSFNDSHICKQKQEKIRRKIFYITVGLISFVIIVVLFCWSIAIF